MKHLSKRVVALIRWLHKRNIFIVAIHLPGVKNKVVDCESRRSAHATHNWALRTESFLELERRFCPEGIDLDAFAQFRNSQKPRYWAYYIDPMAEGFNFFAQDLSSPELAALRIWCFPPPHLIGDMVAYLIANGKDALILVPMWQDKAWWTTVVQQMAALPIILAPEEKHFCLKHGLVAGMDDLQNDWHWIAIDFSGTHSRPKAFRDRLRGRWSQGRNVNEWLRAMTSTSECLRSSRTTRRLRRETLLQLLSLTF